LREKSILVFSRLCAATEMNLLYKSIDTEINTGDPGKLMPDNDMPKLPML
jgi:hypothetical protein